MEAYLSAIIFEMKLSSVPVPEPTACSSPGRLLVGSTSPAGFGLCDVADEPETSLLGPLAALGFGLNMTRRVLDDEVQKTTTSTTFQ